MKTQVEIEAVTADKGGKVFYVIRKCYQIFGLVLWYTVDVTSAS